MSRRTPRHTVPIAAAALVGAGLAVLPATSAGAATTTVRTESQLRSALERANRTDGEDCCATAPPPRVAGCGTPPTAR